MKATNETKNERTREQREQKSRRMHTLEFNKGRYVYKKAASRNNQG
jgi:hypothetical protein